MTTLPPEILELRKRGYSGDIIGEHRAFRRIGDSKRISWSALALVVALTAVVIMLLPQFARFWQGLLEFVAPVTGFSNEVATRSRTVLPFVKVDVPYLTSTGPLPSGWTWSLTVLATIVLLTISLFLPRRLLALIYLLRLIVIIQATSLAYFAVFGAHFPYTLPRYSSDMFTIGLAIIALVPLIFGLTYFIFDFGVGRKVLIVLVTVGHLLVFVPLQYLMHVAAIKALSMLYLPVLFMIFGALLDVSVLIALYGWGMSWRDRAERMATKPREPG